MSSLFRLPEYDTAFNWFVWRAVHALTEQHPVLGEIGIEMVESVPTTRMTMPSGDVIESKPRKYLGDLPWDLKDAVVGRTEGFVTSIYEASEQISRQMMTHLFQFMDTITGATGNVTHLKGGQVSFDHILETLEKLELQFDDDGNPDLSPYILVSQRTGKPIPFPPPTSEEHIQKFVALMERKRTEYNDRRRNRKLS